MEKPIKPPKYYYCPYSETKCVKCDMQSPCIECKVFYPSDMENILINHINDKSKFYSSNAKECDCCGNMTYNIVPICEKCNAEDEYELS